MFFSYQNVCKICIIFVEQSISVMIILYLQLLYDCFILNFESNVKSCPAKFIQIVKYHTLVWLPGVISDCCERKLWFLQELARQNYQNFGNQMEQFVLYYRQITFLQGSFIHQTGWRQGWLDQSL